MSAESSGLRRLLAGLAAAGVVACLVPLVLAIDSVGGHHRDLIAVFGPLIGGASIGTGLLAWQRRPENRFGALLVAVGFTYCLSGLIVSTDPWPFVFVADRPELSDVLSRTRLALVTALILVLGVVVSARWLGATRPQRRALTLVYASGGLVLALYAVWAVLGVLDVAPGTQETLERARVVALATVPFAFLAGLLRSRVAGASAVSDLVARLGGGVHGSLRDALAGARGDPSLTLAYWLGDRKGWVDATGGTIDLPEAGGGRACTPVERGWEPIAMLIQDASVAEERELVQAVVGAAALAWRTSGWRPSCTPTSRSCAPPARGSSRAPTPPAAGSSATCTTARSEVESENARGTTVRALIPC